MAGYNKNKCAIGVFDSGLGGLTVVKELIKKLPHEDIIYFGDTARVPYGTKSKESIIRFSKENARLLMKHHVKLIIIACNSSSSVSLHVLRRKFPVDIIDVIHPGARRAIEASKNKRIGIIATQATIHSGAYAKAVRSYKKEVEVFSQSCPLFVPLAEEGWFKHSVSTQIAAYYLSGLKRARIDTLILGCTHYPLLKSTIQKVIGVNVTLIDSAQTVAKEVKDLIKKKKMENKNKTKGKYLFLVSDEPKHFQTLAKRFLGRAITDVRKVQHV